jgi:hypothetical protein
MLIAYENLADGIRAQQMSKGLAAHLDHHAAVESDFWKFDLLDHPDLREWAVAEAAAADVVILATCGTAELPGYVTAWLESWLGWQTEHTRALVALLDPEPLAPSASRHLCGHLREAAGKAGVAFFCQTGAGEGRCFEAAVPSYPNRLDNSSALAEAILSSDPAMVRD